MFCLQSCLRRSFNGSLFLRPPNFPAKPFLTPPSPPHLSSNAAQSTSNNQGIPPPAIYKTKIVPKNVGVTMVNRTSNMPYPSVGSVLRSASDTKPKGNGGNGGGGTTPALTSRPKWPARWKPSFRRDFSAKARKATVSGEPSTAGDATTVPARMVSSSSGRSSLSSRGRTEGVTGGSGAGPTPSFKPRGMMRGNCQRTAVFASAPGWTAGEGEGTGVAARADLATAIPRSPSMSLFSQCSSPMPLTRGTLEKMYDMLTAQTKVRFGSAPSSTRSRSSPLVSPSVKKSHRASRRATTFNERTTTGFRKASKSGGVDAKSALKPVARSPPVSPSLASSLASPCRRFTRSGRSLSDGANSSRARSPHSSLSARSRFSAGSPPRVAAPYGVFRRSASSLSDGATDGGDIRSPREVAAAAASDRFSLAATYGVFKRAASSLSDMATDCGDVHFPLEAAAEGGRYPPTSPSLVSPLDRATRSLSDAATTGGDLPSPLESTVPQARPPPVPSSLSSHMSEFGFTPGEGARDSSEAATAEGEEFSQPLHRAVRSRSPLLSSSLSASFRGFTESEQERRAALAADGAMPRPGEAERPVAGPGEVAVGVAAQAPTPAVTPAATAAAHRVPTEAGKDAPLGKRPHILMVRRRSHASSFGSSTGSDHSSRVVIASRGVKSGEPAAAAVVDAAQLLRLAEGEMDKDAATEELRGVVRLSAIVQSARYHSVTRPESYSPVVETSSTSESSEITGSAAVGTADPGETSLAVTVAASGGDGEVSTAAAPAVTAAMPEALAVLNVSAVPDASGEAVPAIPEERVVEPSKPPAHLVTPKSTAESTNQLIVARLKAPKEAAESSSRPRSSSRVSRFLSAAASRASSGRRAERGPPGRPGGVAAAKPVAAAVATAATAASRLVSVAPEVGVLLKAERKPQSANAPGLARPHPPLLPTSGGRSDGETGSSSAPAPAPAPAAVATAPKTSANGSTVPLALVIPDVRAVAQAQVSPTISVDWGKDTDMEKMRERHGARRQYRPQWQSESLEESSVRSPPVALLEVSTSGGTRRPAAPLLVEGATADAVPSPPRTARRATTGAGAAMAVVTTVMRRARSRSASPASRYAGGSGGRGGSRSGSVERPTWGAGAMTAIHNVEPSAATAAGSAAASPRVTTDKPSQVPAVNARKDAALVGMHDLLVHGLSLLHGDDDPQQSLESMASVAEASMSEAVEIAGGDTFPLVWVTQYVDMSHKYGLGFLLSDGSSGVRFNDTSKLILDPAGVALEYVARSARNSTVNEAVVVRGRGGGEETKGEPSRTRHTLEVFPEYLEKKVKLLKNFRKNLEELGKKDEATGGPAAAAAAAATATATRVAVTPGGSGGAGVTAQLTCVVKWRRTRKNCLFWLSDGTVQVRSCLEAAMNKTISITRHRQTLFGYCTTTMLLIL